MHTNFSENSETATWAPLSCMHHRNSGNVLRSRCVDIVIFVHHKFIIIIAHCHWFYEQTWLANRNVILWFAIFTFDVGHKCCTAKRRRMARGVAGINNKVLERPDESDALKLKWILSDCLGIFVCATIHFHCSVIGLNVNKRDTIKLLDINKFETETAIWTVRCLAFCCVEIDRMTEFTLIRIQSSSRKM